MPMRPSQRPSAHNSKPLSLYLQLVLLQPSYPCCIEQQNQSQTSFDGQAKIFHPQGPSVEKRSGYSFHHKRHCSPVEIGS
eukprot:Gb_29461 [translate_table: standard]